MIRPLALYIGLRYTKAKRRNRFISFISLASMLGIALGVTVLITVLSVMNGFDEQIRNRFFALAPQVTVATGKDNQLEWSQLINTVQKLPEVKAVAPFVSGQAMLMKQGLLHGVNVLGILPSEEEHISNLSKQVIEGSLKSLQADTFNLVIGQSLALQLGLKKGDQVTLLTAQTTTTPLGLLPRYRRFTISGIFSNEGGFGFEQLLVYTALSDAQKLFLESHRLSGVHVKLFNLYQAAKVNKELHSILPIGYVISDWTEESGVFFQALAMEKMMMFIILMLIIAIAVFNLVSTLIMVVNEKQADIAILRTLGATPGQL